MGIAHNFIKTTGLFRIEKIAVIGPGRDKTDIAYFCNSGINTVSFDISKNEYKHPLHSTIEGDFNKNCSSLTNVFDAVWACHVLEHQRNVGLFLDNIHNILKPEGVLFVSVPPCKQSIVGGHLTVWNMGLLLYNLVLSGFNVKEGRFKKEGYNIFGVCKKSNIPIPKLNMDAGDLELLKEHWPTQYPLKQNTSGIIDSINWLKDS